MKQNETNEKYTDNQGQIERERVRNAQDAASTAESNPLSRRAFFGCVSASTVVAAAGAGLPSFLLSEKASADDGDGDADDASSRRGRSYRIRKDAANEERRIPTPPQISNGDETRYPNFIGNFSQGLPHDSIGEVDPAAYKAAVVRVIGNYAGIQDSTELIEEGSRITV